MVRKPAKAANESGAVRPYASCSAWKTVKVSTRQVCGPVDSPRKEENRQELVSVMVRWQEKDAHMYPWLASALSAGHGERLSLLVGLNGR